MRLRLVSFAPLVLALLPGGIAGQSAPPAPTVPVAGDWSVSASLFTSSTGSVFTFGRMLTDRLALGMELDLRRIDSEETIDASVISRGDATSSDYTIGPTIKWYGTRDTPVSPYLRAKFAVGWDDEELIIQDEVQRVEDIFRYQGSLSIGAEWYPIRYLGIGAHAGLQWLNESYDSAVNDVIRDRSTTTWGTFRSGLELHFYFR
ncbi:MAG: hypothetical protein KJO11_16725 [Gemmatimonadetes bacterium]|nr:hypothetical protein [Gemmatimonadota bacterium]MBT8402738.1 hypothetical protein [Gemmatimonadota bacterium]